MGLSAPMAWSPGLIPGLGTKITNATWEKKKKKTLNLKNQGSGLQLLSRGLTAPPVLVLRDLLLAASSERLCMAASFPFKDKFSS